MSAKKLFHEQVADKLIAQLEAGVAPWQKPWIPGESSPALPVNATTGERYHGANVVQLMAQGYDDPRWCTYQQAKQAGAQVRAGERGTTIEYFKFTEEQTKRDEQGRPVLDAQGKPVKEEVQLERPRCFHSSVFNAQQINGLPPLPPLAPSPEQQWSAVERAEHILAASGAQIKHDQHDQAYYRPGTDTIHLPKQSQFPDASGYYATALHEVGHWTGHESRLDRPLASPFGSEGYAKEELRAEIASMIVGEAVGIGHDPQDHAAYVDYWVKALRDDPMEIVRAAGDAEKISSYVMAFEQQQVQVQDQAQDQQQPTPALEFVLSNDDGLYLPAVFEDWEDRGEEWTDDVGDARVYKDISEARQAAAEEQDSQAWSFRQYIEVHVRDPANPQRTVPFQSQAGDIVLSTIPPFDRGPVYYNGNGMKPWVLDAAEAKAFKDPAEAQTVADHLLSWDHDKELGETITLRVRDPDAPDVTTRFRGEIQRQAQEWQPEMSEQVVMDWAAMDVRRNVDSVIEALREGRPDRALELLRKEPVPSDRWEEIGYVINAVDAHWRQWQFANEVGPRVTPEIKRAFESIPNDLSQLAAQRSDQPRVAQEPAQVPVDERQIVLGTDSGTYYTGTAIEPWTNDARDAQVFSDPSDAWRAAIAVQAQQAEYLEGTAIELHLRDTDNPRSDPRSGRLAVSLADDNNRPKLAAQWQANFGEPLPTDLARSQETLTPTTTPNQIPDQVQTEPNGWVTVAEEPTGQWSWSYMDSNGVEVASGEGYESEDAARTDGEKETAAQTAEQPSEQAATTTAQDQPREQQGREDKTYIQVPYKQKDEAKALGARWDRGAQSWYVPPGGDLSQFGKWPQKVAATPANQEAQDHMQQAVTNRVEDATGDALAPPAAAPAVSSRQYLAVPYEERGPAKAAGAKWDAGAKSWYVGPNADMEKLERWNPERVKAQQDPAMPPREEFADALRQIGCVVSGPHPIMDGQKHRITVVGEAHSERAGAGFYVGHLDGHPAGYMKNNKTGVEMKWKSAGQVLDPEARAALAAQAAETLQERAAEQALTHERTAQRLATQLQGFQPATVPTPYLQAKGLDPQPGVYTDKTGRETVIPVMDAAGKQWSTHYIQEDGTKRFAKDSKKEGCFHPVGGDLAALERAPALVIAEGYATAATLTKALGFAAVAAFDAGNLPAVAQALHAKYPDKPVIVAADDDLHQEKTRGINPGREGAAKAANAVGGTVMVPIFATGEQEGNPKGFSDFNDMENKSVLGIEGVQRQARTMVDAAMQRQQATKQAQAQEREQVQQQGRRAVRVARV